ncbi:MAG TPA: alkaline phosphatase [Bryobacteraceae bacterium]|nr:alkaline phosphatase [Bryobacteraceae bacterium]
MPFLCVLTLQTAGAQPVARHMIVIGVDGLSVDGVRTAKMPHLRKLLTRAAWTFEARGVIPTLSSPNWASVIDGAAPEQHGITSNGYLRRMVEIEPVCRDSEGMFPTIFEVLRTERPTSRIAVFHDWKGFADLVEKHAPDVMQHEPGAARTTAAAIQYWQRNHPDLMFVHLDNVDQAGHDSGWTSHAYYQAVEEADRHIGEIVDMLEEQAAADSTYVLVTSDHGGKGRNHGKNSLAEIQIPWILAGPDVLPGQVAAAVYTYDSAATIAWILGVHEPECWIGRPVLTAFRSAALVTSNTKDCTQQHPTLGDPTNARAVGVQAAKK